ncbi:mucin-4-like isoform X2 [Cyanistes caeruleus]|uniref:mucin-4-like isoform X2 n=1 Tax=Cyanistes caeruleus TaxID=156563 RepID=UPI000CDAA20E|nr:mucin-4-like isoform X2 [Cyanistes caeruleus]
MGTRGWTLSTFLGCCTWILHGLGAVAAVPVTTDGSFTVGTAFPMTTEDKWPHTTLTTEMSSTAADAETFPPWTETDPVTVTSEHSSSVPALVNGTQAPNTTQSTEGNSSAPNMATTAAAITAQHPAVTPEAVHDELDVPPDVPLGTTPVIEDVKDIPANRGGDTDLSTGTTSLPTTSPLAVTWVPEPTAGVTVLLSQGLTTAQEAVEEGVILPEAIQGEASANSSGSSPDARELLPAQQDGAVGRADGINPEPAGEMAPAGEESPLASESGDAGDAINGEFSTASPSNVPPESPAMSGTVENPEKSSLLPGQALSPDISLTPSNGGDGQGVPGVSSEPSGSALSPAASRAPVAPEETEDTATSLPAPGVPTDAESDTNLPVSATAVPSGDVGAVDLASPSLQPAPWQIHTGEQPPLLPDALTSSTDTPSAPGAAYPAPEAGARALPDADGAAETPASPDLATGPEAAVSPSLGESQSAGMLAGAPQEANGLGTGLSSDSDAPSPEPFVPDGLTWPTAGSQVQGAQGVGDTAQAGGPGDTSPYEDIQSDMSAPALQPSVSPADNGELLTGGTEDLANAELSPPSALGDGTGGAPALGQGSLPGSSPPSNAGMKPDLSGPEGTGDLPGESASAPGAVLPPLGSVAGPVSEAETPVSPDLSAAQGAPGSPSFGGSQPWGTAAGAPVGSGLPGAEGPDTDSTSAWDTSSSAVHGPVGPPSPGLGDQLGTSVGLPAAEEQGASTAEPAVEGAGSGIESEPSLSSTAGNGITAGMDQLPSAGFPSGIASPSDVVAPSVSRGDEAGPMSSAAPGPDSLSPASPDGETVPGLGLVQGAEGAEDVAQAGNPESENPNMETSSSAVSPQQGELPGAGSSSGSASPSGDVASSSISNPSSLGTLEGAESAAEGLQPSLGPGTGVLPAAGEGASERAGDGGSTGQSQAPTGMGPAGSETLGGETGGVLQSASSSLSTEGSSLPGWAGEAADETSLPGAAAAGGGLNTGMETAGPQEASLPAPGTQSGANTELSDGKLSKVSVVEVPGGASVNGGPSPGASLVPAAPDNSGVPNGMTTSVAASLLLPGHGLSSGLAPNGDPDSAPSTQSGSSPQLPGSPGGLSEEAGAQLWSPEDEVASGMPAPLGEASPRAPISPNAAPVLPSAPQRGNSAEGVAASPGLSALPAVPLYGYGARENDQEYVERRVDFNSPLFKPETGFPFGKTLRSSLYFTDNGQIIFPASDNNVFTYSNPPPSGFNGHEEVPMIAVFWDNADFSRGVGTTFYQEFSTLNTAKPPFVRDVEAKVRRYMRSSYSAAWTLKITWEKAPVYAAWTDTRKTVTYQAVLTTDGFRSYILMLYQDGGMQWDYTRLTSTDVLIGYTSGDGFYYNDDLTKRPPAAKYRPDQFRGYNTDLRGLWIYKLESRVGNNYRLKCLAWTGQQQEPRAWSQGLPTCPCSLQQGQQDPRFKSSRGGRWGARVSMLHSASPNQHGAGVRCLYDSQDQLIEGRQERYWRSSRQASPYRDQELKLYDWCCNRAGSAHLCARYSEKRPKIGCDGYQSPSTDSSEEAENDSDEQIDGEDK